MENITENTSICDTELNLQKDVEILDPSDKFRPEKAEQEFRDFSSKNSKYYSTVFNTYTLMHTHQTYDFATSKRKEWTKFNHGQMTIMEAMEHLNSLIDESDPDVDVPNIVHLYQTAERIRERYPDNDWFQLTGLVHDLGKLMALYGEPQWCVVGDTFVTGCKPSDQIVFGPENFRENPDVTNPKYSTKLGIYSENCGLRNVTMSWGHDEYLYWVLKNHETCKLPEEAFYMIRYHSFYPWHTGGDYMYLCDDHDIEMLPWINKFNQFDLYSKADSLPDMDQLRPYYQELIEKYIPGKVKW